MLHIRHKRKNCLNGLNNVVKIMLLVSALCFVMMHLVGCVVRVRGKRRPLVRVGKIKSELELEVLQQEDELKSSSGSSRKNASTSVTEELRVLAQGDVFHPQVITYLASAGLGFTQQSFKTNNETDSFNGNLTSYGLSMNCLPLKPYPFGLNFNRANSLVARRFSSPLRVESSSEGFFTKLKIPDWPMRFSWSNNRIKQDSDISTSDDSLDRTSEKLSYSLMHDFSDYSHLTFRSDIDKLSQKAGGVEKDMTTGRHRLEHEHDFGSSKQHNLDSTGSFVEKSGLFDSKTYEWSEGLRLGHSEQFQTYYNANFSRSEFLSFESERIGGLAGFRHRLYRNFSTNFNLFTNRSEFGSNSSSTSTGGKLRFDYFRNNPWGRLTSLYSINMTRLESQSDSGTDIVNDESHVFTEPFPITLDQRNVDTDSIIVTNSTGTEIYTEGDDYTISVDGDQVQLNVTTMGIIFPDVNDGQVLLVDYLFVVVEEREEDSTLQSFRIAQEFTNGLSMFYGHRELDRDTESSVETSVTDSDFKEDNFGLGYKKRNLMLRAEHNRTVSSRNSVQSNVLLGSNTWQLTSHTSFMGRISQTWVDSSGTNDRKTTLFKLDGKLKTRIGKHLKLSGRAEWRDEDNSDIGRTRGLRMGASLTYNYRDLSVETGWDSYLLERPVTETTNTLYYLRVIRRF